MTQVSKNNKKSQKRSQNKCGGTLLSDARARIRELEEQIANNTRRIGELNAIIMNKLMLNQTEMVLSMMSGTLSRESFYEKEVKPLRESLRGNSKTIPELKRMIAELTNANRSLEKELRSLFETKKSEKLRLSALKRSLSRTLKGVRRSSPK